MDRCPWAHRTHSRLLSGQPATSGQARGDRRCVRNSAARTLVLRLSKYEPGCSQQPAQRSRPSRLWWAALILVAAVIVSRAAPARAQAQPPGMSMTIDYGDETGLTLREVVTKGLRGLAREYLTPAGMHQAEDEHRGEAQPSGVQFELFTPGDVGVTLRYRW